MMRGPDSAARRLHALLEQVTDLWNGSNSLHSAWASVFDAADVSITLAEGQALLGQLLAEIRLDAISLDPNPPAESTLIHFEEWTRICFGNGFDPGNTALSSVKPITPQSLSYLLAVAVIVERDTGAQEISEAQLELLHRQAEEFLKELRADRTLPADLRIQLILSVSKVAEAIRMFRITGQHGIHEASDTLVATVAVPNKSQSPGLGDDSIFRRLQKFALYLVQVLRWGQVGAALLEGNIEDAIDAIEGSAIDLDNG